MDVTLAGIAPEDERYLTREIRILPRNTRSFGSPYIMRIPTGGLVWGEMSYSVIYGPPSGFPAYRRTHKILLGLAISSARTRPPAVALCFETWSRRKMKIYRKVLPRLPEDTQLYLSVQDRS
jgi:hypothetical protein